MLLRGGAYGDGASAGLLTFAVHYDASNTNVGFGFILLIRGAFYSSGPLAGLLSFAVDNTASGTYVSPRISPKMLERGGGVKNGGPSGSGFWVVNFANVDSYTRVDKRIYPVVMLCRGGNYNYGASDGLWYFNVSQNNSPTGTTIGF